MKIGILSGIYTKTNGDYRNSYPMNLVPVPKQTGISESYLRTADGVIRFDTGAMSGTDRGGINWNGILYRVVGSSLVKVDSAGVVTYMGDVGNNGVKCSFDYSFDRMCIGSNGHLYYFDGSSLTVVTDPDMGTVNDVIWVDGYFMTTDGTSLIVTELNDPMSVNPFKYGSSESDPDPITGLLKIRGEVYAFNRYTIEVFQNVGGAVFPFQRISGALVQKGAVGKDAKCKVAQTYAFLGSGRNEPCSVWLGGDSNAVKIATREIEQIISKYTESQLSSAIVEAREFNAHQHIYIHLPNETLVYDLAASAAMQSPIWFTLSSGTGGQAQYRAFNLVYVYNKWIVGDKIDGRIGYLDSSISTQYGDIAGWQFDTAFLYNQAQAGIIHELELVAITGLVGLGVSPSISLSHTKDGFIWSNQKFHSTGQIGQYNKRITWRRVTGLFRKIVGFRFIGVNSAVIAFSSLEAKVEALNG